MHRCRGWRWDEVKSEVGLWDAALPLVAAAAKITWPLNSTAPAVRAVQAAGMAGAAVQVPVGFEGLVGCKGRSAGGTDPVHPPIGQRRRGRSHCCRRGAQRDRAASTH